MSSIPYKSLTISGKFYPEKELVELAEDQINKNAVLPWKKNLYEFILEWLSDTPKLKIKTSGSTGSAKWMEVEKGKMVKSAMLTGQFFNLQKNDKALLCLPIEFIAGKMMVVRAFVLGLNLIPVEPSGNPLKNLDELFDFAAMTPMQVYNTLALKEGYRKLNQIKQLIIGGGEINQVLLSEIKNLANSTFHTYGMTETLTHVALKKLNGNMPDLYFKALPDIKFEIDKRNCLVISAPHLSERRFITNDIVELNNQLSFNFIGRYDNIINSGGIKISPELVEQKLSLFIKERFIIAGLSDAKLGQKVVLIIEGKEKQIAALTKIDLLKYEIPKQIYFFDQFPETESGKIIRQKVLQALL